MNRVPSLEEASCSVKIPEFLVELNKTEMEYPRDKTVHALFEQQVAETPDSVAVEFESDRLTYRELNRRANALAAQLRLKGCGDETPVGLFVERSVDMLAGLLGILKAGGAYIPLDPFFPEERLAFMIADAQIPILVTQQHLRNDLPKHQAQVVCVDGLDDVSFSPPSRRLPSSSSNLAYILYTSGSTGRPKGVQISHRAVVNLLHAMQQAPGLRADDVLLAITTLSFDICRVGAVSSLDHGRKSRDFAAGRHCGRPAAGEIDFGLRRHCHASNACHLAHADRLRMAR